MQHIKEIIRAQKDFHRKQKDLIRVKQPAGKGFVVKEHARHFPHNYLVNPKGPLGGAEIETAAEVGRGHGQGGAGGVGYYRPRSAGNFSVSRFYLVPRFQDLQGKTEYVPE